MDSPQPAKSILETLRTVEFRQGIKGYNVDEVDEYLEQAAVEAESLVEQARQATERLRQASERIAQLETDRHDAPVEAPAADPAVADDSLQRTLLLAQRFVDQARRESETEAAEVIAQAEARARAMLAQAEDQARQLSADSERRLREEVTRLESMRGQLATDVENMARHLEAERNRLRSSLADVLKWVDDNIQPATALMALRPRGEASPPSRAEQRPAPEPTRPVAQARPATPTEVSSPTEGPVEGNAVPPGAGKQDDTVAQVLDLRGAGGGQGERA